MFKQIPGHARAHDLWLAILLAVAAGLMTGTLRAAIGAALIIAGAFLGSQATHLAQMHGTDLPPSWLERNMQQWRWVYVVFGAMVALIGLHLLLSK
ncbi:MAG: hypothetical protein Q7S50_00840 [bacterium]|nr:hypothetical protein [bacterium]